MFLVSAELRLRSGGGDIFGEHFVEYPAIGTYMWWWWWWWGKRRGGFVWSRECGFNRT